MDRAHRRIEIWQRLLDESAAPLLRELRPQPEITASLIDRLRRDWPADLVTAAIELSRARRKAAAKFPDPERLVADVAGVEQATSHVVAEHKAARFAEAGVDPVTDLCCGIGGDSMSLARIAEVTAIDHDPLRAWMAGLNAGVRTQVADVTKVPLEGPAFHIDPARRDEASGARRWSIDAYEPGPAHLRSLIDARRTGAIKLGPGVDLDALPRSDRAEIEIINERGTLVQAVLWCGDLTASPGSRRATRLPEGVFFTGPPVAVPIAERQEFDRYLLVPDPAIERAGLAGTLAAQLGVAAPHPGPGLMSSAHLPDSSWVTAFEVLAEMPWRPWHVKKWLRAHDSGLVEIRSRGVSLDIPYLQADLRGSGHQSYCLFVLRFGRAHRAVITRALTDR